MGFFDFFKSSKVADAETYSPGSRIDGITLIFTPSTGTIEYQGRYGMRGSFQNRDVRTVEYKAVSNTHGVLLIQGNEGTLFTTDVLRRGVCDNAKTWIDARLPSAEEIAPKANAATEIDGQQGESATVHSASLTSAASVADGEDVYEELKKLKELYDLHILTEEEFEAKKAVLLKRI